MPNKKKLIRLPSINCPHCHARSIVRDSQEVTDLVRELRMVCSDDDCGHTFVAQLSVIRTIRPAAKPNPAVRVPFGEWRSKPTPANDDSPPMPANDDDHGLGVAIGAAIAAAMTT
jgi:hypothetical protein